MVIQVKLHLKLFQDLLKPIEIVYFIYFKVYHSKILQIINEVLKFFLLNFQMLHRLMLCST